MKIKQFELNSDTNYIKIHGLQRTATNYVAYLIDQNFESTKVLVNIGGWKHGQYCAPWTLGEEVNILVVTKNPYAWLVSMFNYLKPPYDFSKFIRSEIVLGESNGSPYFLRACNPIQHWNNMNFHWMTLRTNTKKLCLLPHEDLIKDTEGMMKSLGKCFDIKQKEIFTNSKNIVEPSNDGSINLSDKEFNSQNYAEDLYIGDFSHSDTEFVNSQIDFEIMKRLGYKAQFSPRRDNSL